MSFNEWLYYLCWVVALVMSPCLAAAARQDRPFVPRRPRQRAGRGLFRVNLATYKTLAFRISAFYAGIAGALLAIATTFVNPDTFPITLSIFLFVGIVVGGLGSLWPSSSPRSSSSSCRSSGRRGWKP